MPFYDREAEIRRLERAFRGDTARLVVVYGRRRCGKSTLLKKVLSPGDLYYIASQADESWQRSQLAGLIAERVPNFDRVVYPDWEALFLHLNNSLRERLTLCLDEFPYLVRSSGALPSILQKLVDRREELKFHLVLCGSSQRMMQGLVLDRSAPLYGRTTEILKIQPLPAGWLLDHLGESPEQAVIEYTTWGGVPRYWELRKDFADYGEAVRDLVLDRLGVLHEEPPRLFLDDMRESVQAYSLMALIAGGSNKISEIAARLQKPATHLSRLLERLIQLGYIERETPFGTSTKTTKKTLYKVSDPFMRFFFTFVAPNLSRLELGLTDAVYAELLPKLPLFVAREWENLCRRSVPMQPIEGISFDQAGRWWGADLNGQPVELDLVARSVDDKHLLVGECKWGKVQHSDALLNRLHQQAQALPFRKGRAIVPVLFAPATDKRVGDLGAVLTPAEVLGRLR